jgi:hypothetical protein
VSKIVLISCAKKKQTLKSRAENLYVSPLFRLNLKYALSLQPQAIYVLSAEHGLLSLETEIEPYDKTLNRMRLAEVKDWANSLIGQLESCSNLQNDHFIILAGLRYRQFLVPALGTYEIPMKGLSLGKQLHYLKEKLNERHL